MIGLTLSDRYELLARVGGGGMALVYKARDLLLNRFVAVKVLRQQFTHDDDFVKRFRREAQAAASLSHPNIVSIYDVGQVEDTHYIVMEFIDGANLNEIIRERAPIQVEEAVRVTAQICDALEHAHHNQIIHRDIKPHNILIGNNGRVKVTDFGIARAVTSSTITQTGSVVGSVHYFSPEHAKGVTTGEKSDIYSLGIVLYQMLTGRLPFLGESPISVALKHLQEPFEQPRKVNPYIPQSVENIILRAMRKNPQERYQSANEMLRDLETCLQPSRLNEPIVYFPSDEDEEAERTRVIPAIRPDMINTMEAPVVKSEDNGNRWNSEGLESKKNRWILPTVLGVLAAGLIGVLIWAISALGSIMNPPDIKVPTVVGMQEKEARDTLEAAGLIVDPVVLEETSATVPVGIVTKQNKQDMEVAKGATIQITVSSGEELTEMPDVTNQSFDAAKKMLVELGVDEENVLPTEVYDDSEPGTVLRQVPKANESIDPMNTTVTLTVSKGREAFKMPELIGKSLNEAKAMIAKYNLTLPEDKISYDSSYAPKGTVFKQFPAEQNEMVIEGQEVQIWISNGYPAESRQESYDITVAPQQDGQSSTIKIVYSDARGDNIDLTERKITRTTTIPVTLVLAPGKDGQILVYRDDQFLRKYTFPYAVIPADTSPQPPETTQPDESAHNEPPSTEPVASDTDAGDQDVAQ
ncbi:MAG: Stk1 family PASTA domain-containing Ser/Thr kinase [Candidatus Cohnella colombiensis]|uniref:Serine/threonine-protein kinase PrkC n=1 Tax=Candidatus Cohnella colombiensis TaxID=3121368 RepID=A0AA95ETP3_9BACL|nr:MAG: Stk1 family PASTA domain-containing Ser/Thr kinase [Cohnella sp.]